MKYVLFVLTAVASLNAFAEECEEPKKEVIADAPASETATSSETVAVAE